MLFNRIQDSYRMGQVGGFCWCNFARVANLPHAAGNIIFGLECFLFFKAKNDLVEKNYDMWYCSILCGENYQNSKPKETWVRCLRKDCAQCTPLTLRELNYTCSNWAHSLCTGDPRSFFCFDCCKGLDHFINKPHILRKDLCLSLAKTLGP